MLDAILSSQPIVTGDFNMNFLSSMSRKMIF